MGNQIRTTILLAVLTALIVWIGQYLGGNQGMLLALLLAAGLNFFSYWYSDKIVLRLYGAQAVGPESAPELYGLVGDLARKAGLPMPKVCIVPQDAPNAFATGRNPQNAVVAVTRGLLNVMDRQELSGVLAHELAHIRNRDILIGSIAATLAGAVMVLANMARWSVFLGGMRGEEDDGRGAGFLGLILMSILAPMAAMIIQMAISRSREYMADATGAAVCGNPEWLARALEKLGAYSKKVPLHANPSTTHMLIVNPFSGRSLMHLFSTHPPLEERIARLRGKKPIADAATGVPSQPGGRSAARSTWDRLSR
jgi:heat shock protein HtpX